MIRYSNVKDTVFYVTLAEFGHGTRCFRVQDQDLRVCHNPGCSYHFSRSQAQNREQSENRGNPIY